MGRLISCVLCAVLVIGTAGCYDGAYRGDRSNDPWWNDRNRDTNRDRTEDNNDDCRRNRGRVDEGKWRYAVDQFEGRRFRKQQGFRNAKDDLMNDLRGVRERACDWERPAVDRLIDRLRDIRFTPATSGGE